MQTAGQVVRLLDERAIAAIEAIIKKGNDAEVKIVGGNIVVVEIKRNLISKTPKTG